MRKRATKPNLKVVTSDVDPDLPMPQRLEAFGKEWMTAAEQGRVIANVREIAASVNLVIRIEAFLHTIRKYDARTTADVGSEVRKYSFDDPAYDAESRGREGSRPGAGRSAFDHSVDDAADDDEPSVLDAG